MLAPFGRRVLAYMKRPTGRERREIEFELDGHVLDRTEALMEQGYSAEEAREKAEEAMGDPRETAELLDAQLSSFWLWAGRAFTALTLLVLVLLVLALWERARPLIDDLRYGAAILLPGEVGL